ncbi:MAG: putative toxin-antitoxin system toxin component, PIN family [Woeseia sp.]
MSDTVVRANVWIVDTNVLVAGLLSTDAASPPVKMVDAMLSGEIRYLLCVELLAEYRTVLLRKRIQRRHGMDENEVDALLEALATSAVVADIAGRTETALDAGDNFLWRLLAVRSDAALVTGDARLLENPPPGECVLSPRAWLDEGTS